MQEMCCYLYFDAPSEANYDSEAFLILLILCNFFLPLHMNSSLEETENVDLRKMFFYIACRAACVTVKICSLSECLTG
jgi:hypothetical protein